MKQENSAWGRPHAPAHTRWGRKLLSLLLAAAMCLSMLPTVALADENTAATTDEYGFNLSVPEGYNANDGNHPFGKGADIKGNLNPTKEISILESRGDSYSSRVYDFDESSILKGSSGGVFSSSDHYAGLDGTKFSTASPLRNATFQPDNAPYRYVSAVAYDPDGSGRDYKVAYWGAARASGTDDYKMKLYHFNGDSDVLSFSSSSSVYEKSADYKTDSYSWMSKLNGYNAEGYTEITAGDFNGNGKETLVYYDPAKGDLQLREDRGTTVLDIGNDKTLEEYFGKTLNEIQKLGGNDLQHIANDTAMVQLEAADLDGKADNKDELIVTISLGNLDNESGIDERGSVVMVLSKKGNNNWETVWSYQFSHVYAGNQPENKYDAGWHLRAAASRAEDIDHDGSMEIVTAGVGSDDNGNDDNFHDAGYFAVITRYTGNSYKVDTVEQTYGGKTVSCQTGIYVPQSSDKNSNWVGEQSSYLQYMNPCSLGIVRFDGRGTVPYIVIRGQIFKYNSADGTLDGADTKTNGLDLVLRDRKIINQPIVGNFDGNAAGREQILFTVSSGDGSAVNIGGYYYKPSDYDDSKATGSYQSTGKGKNAMDDANGDTGEGLRSCRWGMNAWGIAEIALAAPDIDNDGIIASYTGKEYAFNDPQVLAVMEAPPYFEDIEYSNAGATEISFSKGSGSSTGSSTANRIGTYVSFEQDFSLGGVVDLGGFEFETSLEAEWNNSIEREKTFTMTNTFSAEQAESAVVLICIPVTVYHYNTTSADGAKNVMDITVADEPVYKTIPLSEYNAAAAQRGDPEIGSDIIASTAGQPSTYRTTTTGLKNAMTTSNGTNGGWVATESGESSKSQSVEFETSETSTKEFTFNIDAKGGGGAGGFKFGLSGGSSAGSSASSISTAGIERSGTVHDLPTGTTGYSFRWQFVGWETTLTTGGLSYNVPVLSYLVQNVQQPPSKPQNLEAKEVTTDSVTLEWESGFTTAAKYQVYRYMPNNTSGTKYALLGTVSGLAAQNGKYTLTDTEVQPSTQYQYVLKSIGTDGKATDYTDPLAVTTLSDGDMPEITQKPQSTSVRLGSDASFTIQARPTGGATSVSYRWQSRTDGGRWTDLNQDAPTLTIEKPAKSMSGTEYRCIVSQTNMKTEKSSVVYSNTVTLTVGKAESATELSTGDKTGGNATYETTNTAKKTVTAQYKINGTTYQKYDNAYTGTDKIDSGVYGASDSEGYRYYPMTPTLSETPDEDGVYTGTVSGTPTALTAAADRVTLGEAVYKIDDGGFQKTQKTEEINGTTYTVYTAIGVAGEAGTTNTLTLYGKDSKYYRKNGDSVIEMTENTAISNADTNAYLKGSLTESYVTENGYTVLTYTPTEGDALTIYELNGTYYSKNDDTYTSLSLVTGLYQNADGKLFKPGAAQTTEVTTTGSKKQETGDPVTLTATVTAPKDTGAATNGTVTFEITNTTTGSVVRYPVSKSSGNSTVSCSWTPSEAGVYSIVAIYGGNSETAGSRSDAMTYYAKAADDLYEISVSNCTYGDTISPSLKSVTISGTSGSASSTDKTVTYAAYKDGSSAAVVGWSSGSTLVPGTYRITATAEGKVLASKYITVGKKPITITAPNTKDGSIKFESFVNGDDYANLFTTEGMPSDDTAGVYNVSVVYDESITNFADKQAEFFSKYTPTLQNSMVLVQASVYKVTYSNGNNGTLQGYQGSYSTSFTSGAEIASGSNVIFSATPAANYQVWKWTVKSGDTVLTEGTDYTLSTDKQTLTVSSLNSALDVHVEFSNQFYTVSAQSSGGNGSVTATVGGVSTLGSVLSGTEVTFTATPDNGYVVKQWTVKRGNGTAEVKKNEDGSDFSGKELKLTITANTEVNVSFEPTEKFEVHYSAVDQKDTNKAIALNFETTGLTDGMGEKGSAVTLTAKPSSAMGIAGWQYKNSENGAWIDSAITGLSYTIQNLRGNIWVRALVNDNAAATKVHFGIVDEKKNPVAGGTLTAKYTANGAEIQNDADCTTYSTITFTYQEPKTYEVVHWLVNDKEVTANRNDDSKTFTYAIDSLTTETTVNMVVRAKPIVTVATAEHGTIGVVYTLNGKPVTPEEENGKQYVYSGTKATVTATPADNNYVATDVKAVWTKGEQTGSSGTPNSSKANGVQKVENVAINAATTFSAAFVEKPVVTINTVTGGTVAVTGTVNGKADTTLTSGTHVDFGSDLIVTATPGSGYVVNTINGTAVNADKANGPKNTTVTGVGENTNITATFTAKPKVTINTATGGTVEVKGTVDGTEVTNLATGRYVDFNKPLTVTLKPDKGYEVGTMDGVTPAYTDGTGKTTDTKSYTISGVDGDKTITPAWSAIPTVTVNWLVIDKTPGEDGGKDGKLTASVTRKGMSDYAVTDSEDGTLTVYRDSVVTFKATPETGYKTGVWQLNDVQQDSQPTLTITKDSASSQTVEVQFDPVGDQVTYGFKADSVAPEKHKAQLTAAFTPDGGTATNFASGTTPTTSGSITFTVSGLDDGYEVEGWYVDSSKQTGETGTTFTHEVTHGVGMDVQVKIVRKSYTVGFSATNGTVTATAGGTQLANGDSVVGDTSVTFKAVPKSATGYTFAGWTVNGEKSEETSETLTLSIKKNTTVSAAYTLNTVSYAVNYGVISDSEDNGTLTAKNGTKTFDSGAEQPAGSTIVFTATPKDGYQVKGWYTADNGTDKITGTTSEQNEYTITNLTNAADVYVAFEPIPTYDITVDTTGLGHVTATVNDKSVEITDGKLTVSRYDNAVLTAVPDENQYLIGWTLDNEDKGNSSLTLELNDVTTGHEVKADFAASQLVTLKTICGENGALTATAGYGDALSEIDASSTTGIQVEKGKKVVLTVVPAAGCMVEKWTVNGTVQDNLSNTLTIKNLSENTTVEVAFEPLVLYSIPQSNTGYIVSNVEKIPDDYGDSTHIRARGTVTFTVAPESGTYLTALKVNDKNCLAAISNDGNENKLTVVNNQDGSYTITVANVTENITLEATSMQFQTVKNDLTVPSELAGKYANVDALKAALRTQVNKVNASVPAANIQYYDIKLQYTTDGTKWIDASEEHFPANGITVTIPYSELKSGLDNSYTYTVIHMFTSTMKGHTIGDTESITPVKETDDISFTVDSLSPFAIGWYKAPSNPGGGGGGGGAVVSTYVLTFETNGGSAIAQVTKDSGTTVDLAAYQPTRAGYAFAGWFSDKELTKPVTSVKLTANTTVYAKWSQGGESQNPFTDVKKGEFYYDAVLWAVDRKITSGTSATTFSPAASCTRAQMVTFLWRAAGSPKVEDVSNPFTDVKPGAYYYDAVLWAVKNGVTSGTSATTFSPDDTVTRGQTVTFLYRNAGTPDVTGTMPFADVKADAYYAKAVLWAVEEEITNGTSKDQFSPDADCTRGQIVTFLYRANQQ